MAKLIAVSTIPGTSVLTAARATTSSLVGLVPVPHSAHLVPEAEPPGLSMHKKHGNMSDKVRAAIKAKTQHKQHVQHCVLLLTR